MFRCSRHVKTAKEIGQLGKGRRICNFHLHLIAHNVYHRMNMGRGRYIPFYENKIYIHKSVEYRINNKEEKYKPKAYNWDKVAKSPMLEYVS